MDLRKKGFQLPEKINFDPETLTGTYGRLYAEAFERGFGTTIGNALRRVLLSSIEGAAVTSVKIGNVLHEFSTVRGVKEDIVDIVLNIKQLRFKMHTDVPQVVSIKVKGPMDVKGKDIITGPHLEVLTPQLHIATLDKDVDFRMELTVKRGKGFCSSEKNKEEDQSVDVIVVDSIFTPIRKVNFWVEGARVGRATDYDRLIMEIWTDGSITPQRAITQASNILSDYVSLFSIEEESEEMPAELDALGAGSDAPPIFNENLMRSVDELELSVRSANCLKNVNIHTIADLVQRSEQEMLRTKNFGRKSLNEIKEVIVAMGLNFNMQADTDAPQKSLQKRQGGG